MTLRLKIIILFLFVTLPSILIGYYATTQLSKIAMPLKQEIPRQIIKLSSDTELQVMSDTIRYYDEVLTQAARNYAFTGDSKWKTIYLNIAPKLDDTIKTVISLGDDQDKSFFSRIDAANINLVRMETVALDLVDQNKFDKAIEILESSDYWQQKDIYKSGLIDFANRRGTEYSQSLSDSVRTLNLVTIDTQQLINNSLDIIRLVIILSILLAVICSLLMAYLITGPIYDLEKTVREITEGNVDKKVDVRSKDEIGRLGLAFNIMTDNLKQTRLGVEAKVAERTAELQKINKHMTGRELKMIELKKEILRLKEQLNKKSKK